MFLNGIIKNKKIKKIKKFFVIKLASGIIFVQVSKYNCILLEARKILKRKE